MDEKEAGYIGVYIDSSLKGEAFKILASAIERILVVGKNNQTDQSTICKALETLGTLNQNPVYSSVTGCSFCNQEQKENEDE